MPRRDGGFVGRIVRSVSARGSSQRDADVSDAGGSRGGPATRAATPVEEALLDSARGTLNAMLADLERLRPGAVRRRALDLNCGSGSFAQALCERFDECDGTTASEESLHSAERMNRFGERCRYQLVADAHAVPFEDETFDFVRHGTVLKQFEGERTARLIAEIVRVLRLLGVAVIEVAGEEPVASPRALPEIPTAVAGDLEAGLVVPREMTLESGAAAEVEVTVDNAGGSVLGSAVAPLRLEMAWLGQHGAALGSAAQIELPGMLLPGDSTTGRLRLASPPQDGSYLLALALIWPGPWSERRSSAAHVPVTVGSGVGLGTHEAVALAVEQAGGAILEVRTLEPARGPQRRRYFVGRP